jgi:hypothetical protein
MVAKLSVRPSWDVDRLTGSADGAVTHPSTLYFEIGVKDQEVTSIQLYTPDAAANAAYTLEGTNFSNAELASDAVSSKWVALPITLTAPTSAAGTIASFSNLGVKRLRVKVVTSAALQFSLRHFYLGC